MNKLRLWLHGKWPLYTITLLFLILNNLNHIIGFYWSQIKNTSYTAMPAINTGDYYVYLSYIEQGRNGQIMMSNLYNHLEQTRLMFSPLWYLIGQSSILFHTSNIVSYFIFRLIFSIIFIFILFYLIKKIFPNKKNPYWILIFSLLANGWGAIFNPWLKNFGSSATNLWIPESNIYNTLTQSPLLIFSQILLLLIFILFIKSWEEKNIKYIILANICYLTLIVTHPFDLVIVFIILTVWSSFIYLMEKNKKIIYYYLGILPGLILGSSYYVWLLQDPVMKQFRQQNELLSPNFILYIFGFGLILFLSLVGILYIIKNKFYKNNYIALILLWGILGFIMVYLPLDFSRRLSNGWHIPLVILSAVALIHVYKKIHTFWKISFILIIFINVSFDTWYMTVDSLYKLKIYNSAYFFNKDRLQIFQKIKNLPIENKIILSRANDAGFLPAFTGKKVYLGHSIQTWKFEQKDIELREIWTKPHNIHSWLLSNNIKYIFASKDFLPEFNDIKWLSQEPYINILTNDENFILLEVTSPS